MKMYPMNEDVPVSVLLLFDWVRAMPPRLRQAFDLQVLGLGAEAIAAAMGISEDEVWSIKRDLAEFTGTAPAHLIQ